MSSKTNKETESGTESERESAADIGSETGSLADEPTVNPPKFKTLRENYYFWWLYATSVLPEGKYDKLITLLKSKFELKAGEHVKCPTGMSEFPERFWLWIPEINYSFTESNEAFKGNRDHRDKQNVLTDAAKERIDKDWTEYLQNDIGRLTMAEVEKLKLQFKANRSATAATTEASIEKGESADTTDDTGTTDSASTGSKSKRKPLSQSGVGKKSKPSNQPTNLLHYLLRVSNPLQ